MLNHQTADQEAIRKVNTSIVLNALRLYSPISRAELAVKTKLNRSTVTNIVNELLEEGLVTELETLKSGVGRPRITLVLKPEAGAVIGMEFGVGFITTILTDFVARILWREHVQTSPTGSPEEIIAEMLCSIDRAVSQAQKRDLRVLGVAIGAPGLVDTRNGELILAPNYGWKNVPFAQMINLHLNFPLYLQNEATLGALGEYYFGAAREVENLIFISPRVGLGGGLIINGKLYRGKSGLAGEIGHIQRDPEGELCGCGRRGCWETQVDPRVVVRKVRAAILDRPGHPLNRINSGQPDAISFDQVVDCALTGDALCRTALEEAGRYLGEGIADLANIFDPEMIVIGGAFSIGRNILLPVLQETIRAGALPAIRDNLRVEFSEHGADACVLGAVAIVLDDIIRSVALV